MQHRAITINRPVVLVPLEEYQELLAEAGYLKTPQLSRRIRQARRNFAKNKAISWKKVKQSVLSL